jgi:hypothetical protein
MPEATTKVNERPGWRDKLNSRKFLITLFAMLADILMMYKGLLSVKDGMYYICWFQFSYVIAEGLADSGAFGNKKLMGALEGIFPMLAEFVKKNGKVGEGK